MLTKIRKLLSPDSSTRTVAEIESAKAEAHSELERLRSERATVQRDRKARILEADAKELRALEGKASDLTLEIERVGVVLQRLDEELGAARAREREAAREAYQAELEALAERGRGCIEEYRKLAPKVVKALSELDEIDRKLLSLRATQRSDRCPDELRGVAIPQPPSYAARTHRVPRLPDAAVIPPAARGAPAWEGDRPSLDYLDPEQLEREREAKEAWEAEQKRFQEETERLRSQGLRRVGVQVITDEKGSRYDLSKSKVIEDETYVRRELR